MYCEDKVLAPNQYCTVKITINDNEQGIITLQAKSNLGIYPIEIKVNTAPKGVLALDNPEINTTKEVTRKIMNLGHTPIKINKLEFEEGNKTLRITENHCNVICKSLNFI